jgi:hypothetical protein
LFLIPQGSGVDNQQSVNTSAISEYLILETGISLQFIGDPLKCIHL